MALNIVYSDFIKEFHSVSHSLEKIAPHGLDGCIAHWVKNWLDGWVQRVTMNGVKSSWQPVTRST